MLLLRSNRQECEAILHVKLRATAPCLLSHDSKRFANAAGAKELAKSGVGLATKQILRVQRVQIVAVWRATWHRPSQEGGPAKKAIQQRR